jgi:hypothetical protein
MVKVQKVTELGTFTVPDPTPIFSDFFLITYPQAHYLQSLIYCFKDEFCVKIYFASSIAVRSTPYEKGEGSGSVPLTNESGVRSPILV